MDSGVEDSSWSCSTRGGRGGPERSDWRGAGSERSDWRGAGRDGEVEELCGFFWVGSIVERQRSYYTPTRRKYGRWERNQYLGRKKVNQDHILRMCSIFGKKYITITCNHDCFSTTHIGPVYIWRPMWHLYSSSTSRALDLFHAVDGRLRRDQGISDSLNTNCERKGPEMVVRVLGIVVHESDLRVSNQNWTRHLKWTRHGSRSSDEVERRKQMS